MSKSNSNHHLVSLSIIEDDCQKYLEGIYFALTPESAAVSALFGECHNIDDDTAEEFQRQIEQCAYQGEDVIDDIFTYNVSASTPLDLIDTNINGKDVQLAVPQPRKTSGCDDDNKELYLVDIMWGVYSYEKNLAPIVWATDEDDALVQALLSQSVVLADEDDEDDRDYYAELRSDLTAKIKASDEWSLSDSSGLYVARSATKLQPIDFTLDGAECKGFINPNDDELLRVYQPYVKK